MQSQAEGMRGEFINEEWDVIKSVIIYKHSNIVDLTLTLCRSRIDNNIAHGMMINY